MRDKKSLSGVRAIVFVFLTFSFINCGTAGSNDITTTNSGTDLSSIASWTYQLQNIEPDTLGASAFDLAVIDYSGDGSDEEAFSTDNVTTMKGTGNSAKLLLAYISIGEAEDYRYYFDASANYVDTENPDWPGNYKVHYWEETWQIIIESYLDRVIAAGFDGAYFDIIDAYEYYGPGGDAGMDRASAADDMVNFVIRLADYAHDSNADFLIFPQNGADILEASSLSADYLDAINGIGVEDTFYFGDDDINNDLDEQTNVIANLDEFRDAEKIVLSVDYLTDPDKITDFYQRATDNSYIPYATVRSLDTLTVNDEFEP